MSTIPGTPELPVPSSPPLDVTLPGAPQAGASPPHSATPPLPEAPRPSEQAREQQRRQGRDQRQEEAQDTRAGTAKRETDSRKDTKTQTTSRVRESFSDDPYGPLRVPASGSGALEEVIVAVPDVQGRLQGSRLSLPYFLDGAARDGFDACVYLLASDVEMNTGPGYAIDAWEEGFGDFVLRPDPSTLRTVLPWDDGTALVLADALYPDGSPVDVAPRQVLRAQLDRLDQRGLAAVAGTELEFLVFLDSYRGARDKRYAGLAAGTQYNVDYALHGLSEIEPVVRRIRREAVRAGLALETARGECHPGQYEIVFRYANAMTTCDNHVFFKNAAKQIAAQEGVALTFMPKYDDGEGNSCHIHLSLRRKEDGAAVFAVPAHASADPRGRIGRPNASVRQVRPRTEAATEGMSELMRHFVAGQLACLPDFTLLMAPNINSYKRLQPGAFAPTGIAWGRDNRTCPVRVVGSGSSLRLEHRVPGGDANPYLAVAATVAAGLYGIENRLPLPAPQTANAFGDPSVRRLPGSLTEALYLWEHSEIAPKVFGEDVVAHYAQAARAELAEFERTVTDWERMRGFERL